MKKRYIPLISLLLLSTQTALATTELDSIIVTATRTAQTADETLASVTVINREDIERQQAQSVQDVLRGVPGISISNSGGAGKATSLFMRGTESDHVLVLIDGIKVGSATLGTTAFQHLPIEQIERIEVVRGPRSSLYGSEAIGGVIQIFTRKARGTTAKPFFSIGGGSYGSSSASMGASGRGENSWFSVSASGQSTDGFNACKGNLGAACFTIEPDKDGNQNRSGSLRAGYQFEDGLEVDGHVLRSSNETEFDGGFSNESKSVQQVFGGSARLSPMESWQLTLIAGRSLDESDTFKEDSFQGRIDTQRDSVSLQSDFFITDNHLLTLGSDYQNDTVDSDTAYVTTARNNRGLFGQYQSSFGANDIEVSLRRDDNEQFEKRNTGGFAWGYTFGQSLRINASYGTAFKAPTFNELYWPGFGNADLKPEKSRSTELGLRGKEMWGHWSFTLYETRIEQLIAFDAAIFAPGNVDQVRIQGMETTLTTQIKGWNFNTNLSLLDPENESSGVNNGKVLARRAKQSFRFDIDRSFGKISAGATLFVEGKRYDDLANTRKINGYGTTDLRAEYAFAKVWKLQTRIENLLDKEYETASFYNQAGRSFFVTLRYQP
ncbi:Outer membrane vitamin B12 receptor BtuB [hydrothermal vent metagenome]|uniref:Outer membrane vitamin B12 receptor BtuB n=1 Tax=hydrothermal vent metagenome TaxID=652676 RepID=A0A3B0YY14_9ZZZZ